MSAFADDMRAALDVRNQLLGAGIAEDDPDLADLVDSECDMLDRLRRILRVARMTEGQSKALAEIQAEMRERKARLDRKVEGLRGVVLWAMGELGLKKIEAPDLTATAGVGKPKVIITNEASLPDDVCVMSRTPSRQAIAAALLEGPVPGAELSNGSPSLTVRVR